LNFDPSARVSIGRRLPMRSAAAAFLFFAACVARAQTIQPVIVEYTEKADGRFEVTNDTLTPMAIVLEPRSFSIDANGRGVFRALDPGIHVTLSASSFRLEPKQTFYVFYKATAESLPSWFTIYAAFSPVHAGAGMTVRVMLPHTVYLYQKKPVRREAIHVSNIVVRPGRDPDTNTIDCDLENDGPALVRVQEVRAVAGKTSAISAGFPLLPGSSRHLAIDWKDKNRPDYLLLHFPKFDVKEPVTAHDP
jgi:hypothetical protein